MRNKIIVILFAIAVVINFSLAYTPRTTDTLVCCDEFEFYSIANNLASGNGYSIEGKAPFNPTLMREPIYPLFLSFLLKTTPPSYSLIIAQFINSILAIIGAILLWKISKYILPKKFVYVPSILFMLSPRVAYYSSTILSDIPALFLLLSGIVVLFHSYKNKSLIYYLLTGVIFGILVLTKMSFILFIPILLIAAIVHRLIQKNKNTEKGYPASAILLVAISFIFTLSPWVIRNITTFEDPALTVRTGQLLEERTRSYDKQKTIKDLAIKATEDSLPILRERGQEDEQEYITTSFGVVYGPADKSAPGKFYSLVQRGFSETQSDKIMINNGIKKILEHPIMYLLQFPSETAKFFYPEFIPGIFGVTKVIPFTHINIGIILILSATFILFAIRGFIKLFARPTIYNVIIGMTIIYAAGVHIPLYVTPRYGFIIYPFLLIFVTAGIFKNDKLPINSLPPFFLIGLGIINFFTHSTIPITKAFANVISTSITCVSCTPMHFYILDIIFSMVFILLGIAWFVFKRYSLKISTFLTVRYKTILKIFILLSLTLIAASSMNRLIAIVEIEHIHSTWYIFNGYAPYSDFFEQHHPLLWYSLAPILYVTGETISAIFIFRLIMLMMAIGIFGVAYSITKYIFDKKVALISLVFTTTFVLLLDSIIEIRPDIPQTLLGLLGIRWLLIFLKEHKLRYLLFVGLSLGLAFLFIQKIIYICIILGLLLLYEIIKKQVKIKSIFIYIFGFLIPLLPYYTYLFFTKGLEHYFINTWVVNAILSGRSNPLETISLSIIQNILLWALALYGIIKLLKSDDRLHGIMAFLTIAIFLSSFLFKFPAKQYFSIQFVLIAIIAAYGFDKLSKILKFTETKCLLAILIIIIVPIFFLIENAVPNNRVHLEKIQYILDNTKNTDYVSDSTMHLNIFRRDVSYFWYAVDPILSAYNKFSPQNYNLCYLIESKKPKIIIDSQTFPKCSIKTNYSQTKFSEILLLNATQ